MDLYRSNQQGLVRTILLIIVLIAILSFIGFDIRTFVESDIVQKNFSYVWSSATTIWNNYLSEPILYFWNNIFVTVVWESFIQALENIKEGENSFGADAIPGVGTTTE